MSIATTTSLRRALLLGALSLSGAAMAWGDAVNGSGRVATENRPVAAFDAVAVAGAIDVELRQSGQEALSVSADDNVLPLIETVVEADRTLHIRFKRGASVSTRTPVKVKVDVVRLVALSAAGSGQLRIAGLKTPALKLSIAGSGDARFDDLKVDAFEARIAGSGSVVARGSAGQAKLTISGSGDIDLLPLAADDVKVSIAGSGDAKVTANRSLQVSIAGSGDVVWAGTATDVKSKVAGSGQVTRR